MIQEAGDGFLSALLDDDAEQLYERAPCGYLSTTADGTIIKVNQTFLDLTGYERADLVGRRAFAELLSAGGRLYHETHYAPMLRMNGSAREIALEIVRPDGSRVPVLVNSVLETDEDGRPHVIRTAVFDATERRQYEKELLRARRLAEESEARARSLSQTLQQTLLPPSAPDVAGLEISTVYRPAGAGDEVGGDFYDIFQLAEDDWAVVIGDVCGKGVSAAVLTSLARYTLRAAAVRTTRPSAALTELNGLLLRSSNPKTCTVIFARLHRADTGWTITLTVAGHPLPLRTSPGGTPTPVGQPGTLLGAIDRPRLHDTTITLAPGQTLLFYTDGVSEARRGRQFYGDQRVAELIAAHPDAGPRITDLLLADVLAFQDDMPRDDIAIVALSAADPL